MALRGAISDFGLADVFQLIANGQRSGTVHLEDDVEEFKILVKDGWIVELQTSMPSDSQLGSRMVQAGTITSTDLGWALGERARSGATIGEILTQSGKVPTDTVIQFATLQVTDTLLELFTWQEGNYAFQEHQVEVPPSWSEPISADHILIRGIALVDEWPKIQNRIPSKTWVVAHRRNLPPPVPEGSNDLFSMNAPSGPSDEERVIHRLAEPGTKVQSIISRAPLDRFATLSCLCSLMDSGAIQLSP